jgi:filamentous hemagglutinin family protein
MRQTNTGGSGVGGVGLGRLLAACGLPIAVMAAPTLGGPQGEQVVRGNVRFERSGSVTTIRASDRAIIRYSAFNIAGHETVRFVQPSTRARVLNRIESTLPTRIDGNLLANGRVYLVNPSGIFFGPSSVVNTGGIVAAAGHLSDADFLRGVDRFTGLTGSVENQGRIDARTVMLLGGSVVNSGVVSAPGGTVVFAAGDEVYVGERGGRIFARVSKDPASPTSATGVEHTGSVLAEGGRINMSASDVHGVSIRSAGLARARQVRLEGQGRGPAEAGRGVVEVTGTLDASQARGRGGEVVVLGDKVALHDATLNASGARGGGTVLVGGNVKGQGPERNASAVFVGEGATLRADATVRGDGGTVVVWSDLSTKYYGSASARGAGRGGDGGFIETSSKDVLDMRGWADAGSAQGKGGLWLLDPRNVTISTASTSGGSFSGGNPDVFTPNANNAIVNVGAINTALSGGTSVTITTSDAAGSQAGNITQNANTDIVKSGGGDATLTLLAGSSITLNGTITSTSGALNLVLTANDPAQAGQTGVTGSGGITIADDISGFDIVTNGGNVTASGTSLTLNGQLNLGSGTFSFTQNGTGTGTISMAGGAVSASAFNLTVSNAGSTIQLQGLTLGSGTSLISAGSDTIQFRGANNLGSGDVTVRAAGIDFRNSTGGTSGVTDLITGTGTLRLQPAATGDAITIGSGASGLVIDSFDLDALAGSGGLLQIGYDQVAGLGTVTIDGATFKRATQVFGNAVTVDVGGATANQVLEVYASGALTVNGDVSSQATLQLHSGRSGTGDLTFGTSVSVDGAAVRLRAGLLDGTGSTAQVDLSASGLSIGDAAGTGTPAIFELRQDASIAALPASSLFAGGTIPTTYTARSDGGSVTITARNQAQNSSTDLTLFGTTGVNVSSFGDANPLLVQSLAATSPSGTITLDQPIRATSGLTFTGPVLAGFTSSPSANFELSAGTGTLTFSSTLTVRATNGFSLILEGDDLSLGGNVARNGSVTASLVIRPATASRNIVLGATSAGTLSLSTAEVAFLQDGFSQLTIGRSDGTGSLTFAGATAWTDPVRFVLSTTNASAIMTVLSAFTTSGDAVVELTANQVAIAAALNLGGFASRTLTVPNTSPVEQITANWSLIVRGAQIGLTQDVTAARGVWLEGTGNTTTLSGTILTNNAPIVIADNVILADAVTLDSANGSSANVGARIIVTGTVNSEAGEFNPLTIRAGQLGDVELRSAVGNLGATQRLGDIDVLIGNRVLLGSTVATGNGGFLRVNNQGVFDVFGDITLAGFFEQTVDAIGGTNLRASLSTDNANITFRRAVDLLLNDVVISTGDSGGGNITFGSGATIDSSNGRGLRLSAGTGDVSLGAAVGGLANLSFLRIVGAGGSGTTGAANVTLSGAIHAANETIVVASGDVNVGAGVRGDSLVSLHAGNDGTGNLTFGAALEIRSADVRLRAGDGTAGGGTGALVSGISNVSFRGAGAIGSAATALDSFLLRQDASITDADIPLASQFPGGFTTPAPGVFHYTLTSDDGDVTVSTAAKVAGRFLALNAPAGTVTINDALAPAALRIDAGAATLNNPITTTGSIFIRSALAQINADLTAGTTLGLEGSIPTATATIGANLTAGTGMTFDYATSTGLVTIQGDRTLRVTNGLLDLVASSVSIDSGTVIFEADDMAWSGEISPAGTASLVVRPATTTFNIDLNSSTASANTLSLTLAQLQAIQGGFAAVTFGGNAFSSVLTVFGAGTSDIMFRNQTIFLMGGTGSRVVFRASNGGGGDRTIRGGAGASLIADVGTNGQIILSADLVTAGGLVQLQDVVAVAGDSSISTSGGNIRFLSTIDSETATPQNLTLDAGSGLIDLQGDVGATGNLLRNLTATGGRIQMNAVSTSEDQTYTTGGDGVFVFGSLTGRNLSFTTGGSGAVVIEEHDLTLTAENALTFSGPLRSAAGEENGLNLRGASITFNGAVGEGAGKFGALLVSSTGGTGTATLNTGLINARSLAFDIDVRLGVDAEDIVVDDSIEFRRKVDSLTAGSERRLRVSSALVSFLGDVGSGVALARFEVLAVPDAVVRLNLARLVTIGDVIFGPVVDLVGGGGFDPVQLRIETGGGNVTFTNDVRSFEDTNANRVATNLRIDHGTGQVRFMARLGTDLAFGSEAGPALVLTGTGLTRFDGSVNLASHMLAEGPVRFGHNVTVNGTTRSELRGDIEVADAAARLFFSGGVLLGDTGNETFTVGRDVTVAASSTGEVIARARFVGPSTLTIGEAGSLPALVRFENHVGLTQGGAESRLAGLAVRAARIELGAAAGSPLSILTASSGAEFSGPVVLNQDVAIDSNGAGRVTFAGTIDSASAAAPRRLAVDVEDESIVLGGNVGATAALSELSLTTADADGRAIHLNAGLIRAGTHTYNGRAVLGADANLTGNTVSFLRTLQGDVDGARSLAINPLTLGTARVVSFGGIVGGNNQRLRSLSVHMPTAAPGTRITTLAGGGTTSIAADVFTTTGMSFGDAVRVAGADVTLSAGNGALWFLNALDSASAGTGILRLRSTLLPGINPGSPLIPAALLGITPGADGRAAFRFGAGVGGNASFQSIEIGGATTDPLAASIVFSGNWDSGGRIVREGLAPDSTTFLVKAAGNVSFGAGHRVLAIGNLILESGTRVVLGDVTTVSDLVVRAPVVEIRRRDISQIAARDLRFTIDRTTSLVAGRRLDFRAVGAVELSGAGDNPVFASRLASQNRFGLGENSPGDALAPFVIRDAEGFFGEENIRLNALLVDAIALPGAQTFLLQIDLPAEGISNTRPFDAGALPQLAEIRQVTLPGAVLDEQTRADLQNLALSIRDLTLEEMVRFLIGRSFYDDAEARGRAQLQVVTKDRVNLDAARAALDTWYELVGAKQPDGSIARDASGGVVQNYDAVRDALEIAWENYTAQEAGEPTGAGLVRSLAEKRRRDELAGEELEALRAIVRLYNLSVDLAATNLSTYEVAHAMNAVLGRCVPPGTMTREHLLDAVRAAPEALRDDHMGE